MTWAWFIAAAVAQAGDAPPNGDFQGSSVGSGVISGGWDYIWAAYLIAWTALAFYFVSLWLRNRSRERSLQRTVQATPGTNHG